MATPTPTPSAAENPRPVQPAPVEIPQTAPGRPDVQENLERQQRNSQRVAQRERNKAETVENTREELEEVKPQSQAPGTAPEAATAAAPAQPETAAPNLAEAPTQAPAPKQTPESTFWNPTTWTPEERSKAATLAGTGVLVVGGLLLGKWIWGKMKSGAEKVKDATGKGWGWLKFGVIASVLTVGGYLGFRTLKTYRETMEKIATAKKQLQALKEKLSTLPADLRAQAEKEIAKLEQQIKQWESGEPEQKPAEGDTKPQGQSVVPPEAREAVQEAGATVRDIIVSKAILHFMGHADWQLQDESKERQLQDVIMLNGDKDMSAVFAHIEQGGNGEGFFTVAETDVVNRKKSVDILTRFCESSRETVIQYLMRREHLKKSDAETHVNGLKLNEYLRIAAMGHSTGVEAIQTLLDNKAGAIEALQSLDIKKIAEGSDAMRDEFCEFVTDNAEALGIKPGEEPEINMSALFTILTGLQGGTVSGHLKNFESTPPKSLEESIVRNIMQELKGGNTNLYVLPCFHDIFPTEEGTSEAERVKQYMLDRMKPDQAVRLYLYRRMMDKGHSTGLVLMQLEVLKFIAEQDDGWFIKEKKYQVIQRMAKKMIGMSGEKLAEEWKKVGVDIEFPEMFEIGAKSVGMVGTGIAFGATKVVQENAGFLWATVKENSGYVAVGTPIVGETLRYFANRNIGAAAMTESLEDWKSASQRGTKRWVDAKDAMRHMAGWPNSDEIDDAALGLKKIFDSPKGPHKQLLEQCVKNPRNSRLWLKLAQELQAQGLVEEAKHARDFATNAKLRKAIDLSRYAHLKGAGWRTGRFLVWGYERALRGPTLWSARNITSLIRGGKTIQDLLTAGATVEELIIAGTKLDDLLRAGCLLKDLVDAGADLSELMKLGKSVDELMTAGAKLEDLVAAVSLLDDAGKTAKYTDLLAKVSKLDDLVKAGADLAELMKLKKSVDDLISAGAKLEDIVPAVNRLKDAAEKSARYAELLHKFSKLDDFVKAGADLSELMKLGKSVDDLMKAGAKLENVISAISKLDDASKALSYGELVTAVSKLDDLVKAGADLKALIAAGKTVAELRTAGAEIAALIKAGVTAREMIDAGIKVEQLVKAGMTLDVLKASSLTATELATAQRTSRLLKITKGLKVSGVLAVAGIGLEGYMYFGVEMPQKLEQLKHETDPAKRDQIIRDLTYQGGGLTANTIGTGMMFVPFPPVQLAGLGVIAANEGLQFTRRSIEEGTSYMLTSEKDLQKYSSGKMLWHIGRSTPLENVTWGQSVAGVGMSDTFREANEATRHEGYRAYFRQTAMLALPELTVLDLSAEDQKLDQTKMEERRKIRTQDELGYFTTSAITFLQHETNGEFAKVDPETLRKAETYALRQTLQFRADMKLEPGQAKPDERTWEEKRRQVDEDLQQKEQVQAEHLAALSADPSVFASQAPWNILTAVKHELADCECRLLNTEFQNWTDGRSWTWRLGSGESEESLKAVARAMYSEKVYDILKETVSGVAGGRTLSSEDIQSVIGKIRTELMSGDPNELALSNLEHKDIGYLRAVGEDDSLLSVEGMLGVIEKYPLASVAPSASESQRRAA